MTAVSSKYLSRNSSTEVSCMKDCTICSKIKTIKLTCSILCRERCKNRVLARNKGITQFNECSFHFYRPFFLILGQHRRSLRSRNKHDHNVYKRHKFAYLITTKIRFARFARFARACLQFTSILLSTTRNDLFYSCQDDETTCSFCHQTAVTNLIPR